MHSLNPTHRRRRQCVAGFSLIELVIVVVIIGIIGAIAIPRMSRGAAGATSSALRGNLAVLRNAIDLYAAEHNGQFPTLADLNESSMGDGGTGNPLLDYTDAAGNIGTRDAAAGRIYGPYLRTIPPLPVGANQGKADFGADSSSGAGWIYNQATGALHANTTTEVDDRDVLYSTY